MMSLLLFISLIAYPDSARVIGNTQHSFGIGEAPGNRVSVRDSRGWIHCVYSIGYGIPVADSTEIYYVFSTNNGNNWSTPMNVSNTGRYSSDEPCLAVDNTDVLHCVWRQYIPAGNDWYLVYSYYEMEFGANQ
jgi:hypothetical protein